RFGRQRYRRHASIDDDARAKRAGTTELGSVRADECSEIAIRRGRRSTAKKVPEDGQADLMPCLSGFELPQEPRAGAADTWQMAGPPIFDRRGIAAHGTRAFRDDDDREAHPEPLAFANLRDDAFEAIRDLRNEDDVCTTSDARVERNGAGMP